MNHSRTRNSLSPIKPVFLSLLAAGFPFVAADAATTAGTHGVIATADPAPAFLRADVKPMLTQLSNDKYSAIAVQSANDVNFVLIYVGALSSGIRESGSDGRGQWGFEGEVQLADRQKTETTAGTSGKTRVVAVKYTAAAPATLLLDGKAYDLAAPPRIMSMGAIETSGRIFLLRDDGEPFQTPRTQALHNAQDLASIGNFAVHDRVISDVYAENRRIQKMEGWVLAWDIQNPLRHSNGYRFARLRVFPDGRVLSSPNGRILRERRISGEQLSELLRWLAEDQKVPVFERAAVQPGDPPPTNSEELDTFVGGVSFLQFKYHGQLHGITVGSDPRPNPGAVGFQPIRERLKKFD